MIRKACKCSLKPRISHATLSRQLNGSKSRYQAHVDRQLLTVAEEKAIVRRTQGVGIPASLLICYMLRRLLHYFVESGLRNKLMQTMALEKAGLHGSEIGNPSLFLYSTVN